MFRIVFYFATALVGVVSAATGCTPTTVGKNGFDARFYQYTLNDDVGWENDFFSSLYRTTLMNTVRGVTIINFQYSNQPNWVPISNYIYGYYTTISNYALELSGFYKAPVSGTFTFRLAADNGASLQFGSGQSCCNDASGSVTGDFNINTLGPYGGGGNTAVNVNQASFSLTKGVYYPVKIVMFNWMGNTGLNLHVTDPSGKTISDFGSQVFQATFKNSKCYTTVTSAWTNTFTSTTTQTGASTDTVIVEIPKVTATTTTTWSKSFGSTTTKTGASTNTVIVEVPKAATTITSVWTGSQVSTTTITGATDTVIVEVPKKTVTLTSTWGSPYATTTTVTGSTTDTVVVALPTPTQTVTSYWTGSFTSSTTVTGGPGENNLVIVEIPQTSTTATSSWTGSNTETHTVTDNESEGMSTQTVTSLWTGSYVTSTTVTGGPGENNTVIVEIPQNSTMATSSWTGYVTETHTVNDSERETGADGEIVTLIVGSSTSTQTVSSLWTGSHVSSTTLTGGTGENNTVIVGTSSSKSFATVDTETSFVASSSTESTFVISLSASFSMMATSSTVHSSIESSLVTSSSMNSSYVVPSQSSSMVPSSVESLILTSSVADYSSMVSFQSSPVGLTSSESTFVESSIKASLVMSSSYASSSEVLSSSTATEAEKSIFSADSTRWLSVTFPSITSTSLQKPYSSAGWNSSYLPPTFTFSSGSSAETEFYSTSKETTSSWASIPSASSSTSASEVASSSASYVHSSVSENVVPDSSFVTSDATASPEASATGSLSATGSSAVTSATGSSAVSSDATASSNASKAGSSLAAPPVPSETNESRSSAITGPTLNPTAPGSTSFQHATSKIQGGNTESTSSKSLTHAMSSKFESAKMKTSTATPASSEAGNQETASTEFTPVDSSGTGSHHSVPAISSSTNPEGVNSASTFATSVISSQVEIPQATRTGSNGPIGSHDYKASSLASQESSYVFCHRGVCVTSFPKSQATQAAGQPISSAPDSSGSVTPKPLNSNAASTGSSVPEPSQYSVMEGGAFKRSAISLAVAMPILATIF